MIEPPSLKKIDILAIASGALLVGMVLTFAFQAFAVAGASGFIGPTQAPPNGTGAISSDASNNVTIGGASTTISGNAVVGGSLTVTGTISASNYSGSGVTAGNVSAGDFGSNGLGGSYAFPGNLGVNTSTQIGLPQPLAVYGGGYFSGSVGIGTTTPGTALDVAGDITDENLINSPFLTTSATGTLRAGTVLGTAHGGTATTTALGSNAFTNTAFLPIATAATSTWVLTSIGGSWVAAAPSGGGLSNGSISATSPITWSGSNVIACPTCDTGTIPTAANPSASIGTSIVNGSATTFMRSDGAPTINQAANFTFSALGNTTSTGNIQASTYTGTSATLSGAANVNSLNVTTTAVMKASTTILGNLAIGTTTLTSGANVFASFGTGTSTVQIGATSTARVGCLELVGDGGSTLYYLTISSTGVLQISSSTCL